MTKKMTLSPLRLKFNIMTKKQTQNEFKKVDSFLQTSQEEVEEFMNHSKKMESSIQTLEEGIRIRVFLLNILSH